MPFNSLRVLLQPTTTTKTIKAGELFQFSSSLIATGVFHPQCPSALPFQFSSSLIATYISAVMTQNEILLSILFESYCNKGSDDGQIQPISLSILFESYCNANFRVDLHSKIYTFNSLRVLLQRTKRRRWTGKYTAFQFSSSLIATQGLF